MQSVLLQRKQKPDSTSWELDILHLMKKDFFFFKSVVLFSFTYSVLKGLLFNYFTLITSLFMYCKIYLLSKSKIKNVQTWFRQYKENCCKRFMIVAAFSYNGKLKIKEWGKMLKIYSKLYQDEVLCPILTEEITFLYPNGFHVEWNFIKTNLQAMLQTVPLHSMKKCYWNKIGMNVEKWY